MVPAFFAAGGDRAGFAFIDFSTAQIRNRNTRAAYAVAVRTFCSWAEARELTIETLRTHHLAAYVEALGRRYSAPTVKQHLAATRMLFDWLVVRQVVAMDPAAAVRGPRHVVKRGKNPVLEADGARQLIDSIDCSTPGGLRDRALIALLIYTIARVSAAIGMSVEDYYVQGRRSWVRLHEKGGKRHDMPAHHLLQDYMDEYLTVCGLAEKASPLFRTAARKTGQLTDRRDSVLNHAMPELIQLPLFPDTAALTRIRPERDQWRFYRLEVWPDLFGRAILARHWGRLGSQGRVRLDPHPDAGAALNALVRLARSKRRRGYQDMAQRVVR